MKEKTIEGKDGQLFLDGKPINKEPAVFTMKVGEDGKEPFCVSFSTQMEYSHGSRDLEE